MAKVKVDKGTRVDCLALGEQALASFTRDELQDILDEIMNRAKQFPDSKGQSAINAVLKQVQDEKIKSLFNDCKVMANNADKVKRIENNIKAGIDVRQQLTPRGKANEANNAHNRIQSAKARLANSFFTKDITKEEIDYISNPKNSNDIYKAMDSKTAPDIAKKVAKRIHDYIRYRNAESVRSDALPAEYLSDYKYLDHFHDPSAMLNGGKNLLQRSFNMMRGIKDTVSDPKQAWALHSEKHLDPNNPIAGAYLETEKDYAKVHSILEGIFDGITQNKGAIKTGSIVVNSMDDLRAKRMLKLNWNDWESFGLYNERYGHNSVLSSLMADMNGSGSRIGMAEYFGTSPKHAYNAMIKAQNKVGIPGKYFKSPGLYLKNNDYIFQALTGGNNVTLSPKIANFMANIRQLTSVVRLVKLGLLSSPDIGHGVAALGRWGNNAFADWGYYMANLWNNPIGTAFSPDRKYLAKQFKLMSDSHLGYVARMIDANNIGQMMSRFTSLAFKAFLVDALDKGNKISTIHLLSKTLGRHSRTEWNNLPEIFRNQLSNHNLTAEEWNLLRTKTDKGLFSLDNLDAVSDQELRNLKSDVPLIHRRADLHNKIYSMFDNTVQQVVLNPTAWTKGMVYRGTAPGTIEGEFYRIVGQFKMYPIDYMDRVWSQGLANADSNYAKLMFATRLIASTLPLSYMSTWFDYYSQGKTMPDPERMTPGEKIRFYTSLIAPGLGMFQSLLNKQNHNKNLAWSLIRSPSTDLIGDALSTILAGVTGDLEGAKKELGNTAKDITPLDTIPFLSPYLREMLNQRPYLQPGQKQKYGA